MTPPPHFLTIFDILFFFIPPSNDVATRAFADDMTLSSSFLSFFPPREHCVVGKATPQPSQAVGRAEKKNLPEGLGCKPGERERESEREQQGHILCQHHHHHGESTAREKREKHWQQIPCQREAREDPVVTDENLVSVREN